MSKPSVQTHHCLPSGDVDHRGVAICRCGSLADASVHRVREIDEDVRAAEARRVGEPHE